MEYCVGSDGLTDADRAGDEDLNTEHFCHACDECIKYGDGAVQLTLVSPELEYGQLRLPEVFNNRGDYAADPLFFEFECWSDIIEDLRVRLDEEFDVGPERSRDTPGPVHCSFCGSPLEIGGCCGRAQYGQFDVRGNGTTKFVANSSESREEVAEIICFNCIELLNSALDNPDIWPELRGLSEEAGT